MKIFTVGHSTRSLDELVALLKANSVLQLFDVRSVPRSRHTPQFNTDNLENEMSANEIAYRRLPGLGGWRKPRPDSPNNGWRNAGFRGYADYMQTVEFTNALEELIALAESTPTAIMCAEAVPWRCHRSLISDALTVRDIEVRHIINTSQPEIHQLTKFARLDGKTLTYPQSNQTQTILDFDQP